MHSESVEHDNTVNVVPELKVRCKPEILGNVVTLDFW